MFDFLKGRDTVHSGRESAIQGSGKLTKLTNHVATREMKLISTETGYMSVFLRISRMTLPYLVSGFATHDYATLMRWVARTSAVVRD